MDVGLPEKFRTFFDPYRYTIIKGGRGSAKSHSIAMALVIEALQKPHRILCCREFQNSIADSVHRLIQDKISQAGLTPYFTIKRDMIEAINGSIFLFEGVCRNADSIKSMEGITRCWVEEADRMSENSWDILIPTIRSEESRIVASYNPQTVNDPVHVRFVAHPREDTQVIEMNWRDNPWFPEVLKREMDHMQAHDYEKYMHIWEGKTRSYSDAQIFKGKFVVEDFSSDGVENFRYGCDFGFANDPTVLIRNFIKGRTLYIDYAEFGYGVELQDIKHLFNKVPMAKKYRIWADCARPDTITFLKRHEYGGFDILGVSKGPNSIEDGIEFLKSFDKIIVHPRCKDLIYEFENYCYKVDRITNEILPIPVDKHNDGIDSIRYSLEVLMRRKTTIYDTGILT
jgi:phage terminase large subunit